MPAVQTLSFAEIKEHAASLPLAERRELIGFLIEKGRSDRENQELREEMARKIDDKDPSHWVSLDELKKRSSD